MTIAALFVETGGCYYGLPHVEPWDQERDARLYAGPHPVVAHPPCQRWGRYWGGAPGQWPSLKLGDDNGCFRAAIEAVDRWGGILEHPEGSHAWRHYDIVAPPRAGGWVPAGLLRPGYTCCVEQGWYGHRGRKATWLYAGGVELPSLHWGAAPGDFVRLEDGFHSKEERARAIKDRRLPTAQPQATRRHPDTVPRSAAGDRRYRASPAAGHPVTKRDKPSGWQDDPLKGAWWLTAFFAVWIWLGDLRWNWLRPLCWIGLHAKEHGERHSWCRRGCRWGVIHALR